MVSLIIGHRGSGKTKHLIDLVNIAVEKSEGNVICIEKEPKLIYEVTHRARLSDTDRFGIKNYDEFYGFLGGVVASDHDITGIFVDATLRIGGRDYEELADFFARVNKLSEISEIDFVFTVSADEEELPARIFEACKKI